MRGRSAGRPVPCNPVGPRRSPRCLARWSFPTAPTPPARLAWRPWTRLERARIRWRHAVAPIPRLARPVVVRSPPAAPPTIVRPRPRGAPRPPVSPAPTARRRSRSSVSAAATIRRARRKGRQRTPNQLARGRTAGWIPPPSAYPVAVQSGPRRHAATGRTRSQPPVLAGDRSRPSATTAFSKNGDHSACRCSLGPPPGIRASVAAAPAPSTPAARRASTCAAKDRAWASAPAGCAAKPVVKAATRGTTSRTLTRVGRSLSVVTAKCSDVAFSMSPTPAVGTEPCHCLPPRLDHPPASAARCPESQSALVDRTPTNAKAGTTATAAMRLETHPSQ